MRADEVFIVGPETASTEKGSQDPEKSRRQLRRLTHHRITHTLEVKAGCIMPTDLTSQQQSIVDALASSGRYSGDAQVLDEALELLKQRDGLRELLKIGTDQLDHGERHAIDDVFAAIRQSRTGT